MLAEFSRASGNFEQVARLLVGRLTPVDAEAGPKRLSFEHGRDGEYLFHVLQTPQGLWFLALADKGLPPRVVFAFLDVLLMKFTTKYAAKDWKEVGLLGARARARRPQSCGTLCRRLTTNENAGHYVWHVGFRPCARV